MTDQSKQPPNDQQPDAAEEEPQIFAVDKDLSGDGRWTFNRRSFLGKVGTASAAAAAVRLDRGANNRQVMATLDGQTSIRVRQLGNTIWAHRGDVLDLAMNANGSVLASGGQDNRVKLWAMPDGALFNMLTDHTAEVRTLAINLEGTLLASAGADASIKLFELPTGDLLKTCQGHSGTITALAISPAGDVLASACDDKTVKLWSLPDGNLIRTLTDHVGAITGLAISADGATLATGSKDGTVKLWSLPDGDLRADLPGYGVTETWKVNADGNVNLRNGSGQNYAVVAYAAPNDLVEVIQTKDDWHELQLEDGSTAWIAAWLTLPVGRNHKLLAISPDSTLLAAAGAGGVVNVYALSAGDLVHTIEDGIDAACALAISPDSSLLAVANRDGTMALWNLASGARVAVLDGHDAWVNALQFSPDGEMLISASDDRTLKLWSTDGDLLNTLEGHTEGVNTLAISPGGKLLASGSSDDTIKLWSLPNGQFMANLVDLAINLDTVEGIIIEMPAAAAADAFTGEPVVPPAAGDSVPAPVVPPTFSGNRTITFTLPCGSPIPAGAVCVCNCVGGEVPSCSCVGHCACDAVCTCDGHCACDAVCTCDGHTVCTCDTVCSCDGHTACSCDTVCTCDSVCSCAGAGHYWYPN